MGPSLSFLTQEPFASCAEYLSKLFFISKIFCLKLSFPGFKCVIFPWSLQSQSPGHCDAVKPPGKNSTGVVMYFPDFPLIVALDPATGARSVAEGCFNIF